MVLYGSKIWSIKKKRRIASREIRNVVVATDIIKVKWSDRVRIDEVLTRIREERKHNKKEKNMLFRAFIA